MGMILRPSGRRFSLEQKLLLRREVLRNGGKRLTPGEMKLFRELDKILGVKRWEILKG